MTQNTTIVFYFLIPIKLGAAAAAPCRSDKEKDLHAFNFRSGGDNDDSFLYLRVCGGRGGRVRQGDDGLEFKDSELSEQLTLAARADELLELIGLL